MNKSSETTRRSFICGSAACALGCVTGRLNKYSAYDLVELGKTGIVTSRLGFGTGVASWNRSSALSRKLGKEKAVKLIREAYDRGIRFFDTADAYGTHVFVKEALRDVPRESYVISTKYTLIGGIPNADKTDVATSIDRFLKELALDYIDIVQIHCVSDKDWNKKLSVSMEALEKAKKDGKIRAHGCSFHSLAALETAAETPWLDVAHVRINPYGRNMSAHPDKVMNIIKKMHKQGKGIIGMKILGVGSLAKEPGKMDASIAYSLNSGAVDVLNIGFLSINEIDDIARRISAVKRNV
jgi:aryl-alcohol dehydrogenase-like predicted oxidoreductase